MHDDDQNDGPIWGESQLEADARLGKTVEDIIEECIAQLLQQGREFGLMGEDIQRILTRLSHQEAERDRGKFKLL